MSWTSGCRAMTSLDDLKVFSPHSACLPSTSASEGSIQCSGKDPCSVPLGIPEAPHISATRVSVQTSTTQAAVADLPSGYPPQPPAGSSIHYASASIPPYEYDPNESRDPRYVTRLKDISGNWIDLAGELPGSTKKKPYVMIEHAPALPFYPGSYNRQSILSRMSDAEIFMRNWRPKAVPSFAFHMAHGWNRMPHPAPVFVSIPHFGASVALYWRFMTLGGLLPYPVLIYAVRKLAALPVGPLDTEFAGPYWEVFATWCKPLKWVISQYPTAASADPYNCVVLTDDGGEFRIPLDLARSSRDYRLRVCRNVLVRDYPFLETALSIQATQPPPEILAEMAQNALARAPAQQVLSGQARLYNVIPGAPSNYPGALVARPVPSPPAESEAPHDDSEAEDAPDAKSEPAATPETKAASSLIGLSGSEAYRLVNLSDANHLLPLAAAIRSYANERSKQSSFGQW